MTNLPQQVAQNIDRFTGRIWLLPSVLGWWEQNNERLFLLTGGPGTGKSMIIAWLAGYGPPPEDLAAREKLVRVRSLVRAVHFCQADSRNITPLAFAESIANQLTERVTGFADAVKATLANRVQISATATAGTVATGGAVTGLIINRIDLGTLGDEFSFDRAFTQPLKQLYANGYVEPMLLLVDALDEALGYSGDNNLPKLLSTLDDLPRQVRILMTSRDDPRVLAFYDEVKPLDLIKDAPPSIDDVRDYAGRRLAEKAHFTPLQIEEFSRRLSSKANGVFLYAAIVLDELLRLSALPDLETYPLPKGLSGLYRAFLKRELGTEDKGRRWHRIYKPLLGLIAVAQGVGLTAEQLTALIGEDIAEPLDACKQYLEGALPDGPFRPFHKSFADFLLEDKHNVRYHIDAIAMHQRIANHYWSKHHDDWLRCDDYALKSLAAHLDQGQQLDRLSELMSPGWMKARVLRDGLQYSGFATDVDLTWRHTREEALRQIENEDEGFGAFVACFRYSLIRTSIEWLSQGFYPPALVRRALDAGTWSTERALEVAATVSDLGDRAAFYAMLSGLNQQKPTKPDQKVAQALTAARRQDQEVRRKASSLHSANQSKTMALDQALAKARSIKGEWARARSLTALAPHLCGDAKTAAVDEALAAVLAAERAFAREQSSAPESVGRGPHFSIESKTPGWGDALAMGRAIEAEAESEELLAQLLTMLLPLPQIADPKIRHEIRNCLISILDAEPEQRANLILNLIHPDLLRWNIIGPDTFEKLRAQIVDVAQRWEWIPIKKGGFRSIYITSPDGLKLHLLESGERSTSGLPVVCLSGAMNSSVTFHTLAYALSHQSKNPRRVLALDNRGHGLSERDPHQIYSLPVELSDLLSVLNACAIERAIIIGTSRGGILAMLLGAVMPTAVAGVVLNDIGPIIDIAGLLRINDYYGKLLTPPTDFAHGADILRRSLASQFPKRTEKDWVAMAHNTWRERDGRLVPNYESAIRKFVQFNVNAPLPTLWNEFDSLANVPMLVIRGALSDVLSADTVNAMRARRRELEVLEIPDQGHVPFLIEPEVIAHIAAFIDKCDPKNHIRA
jgi:pimeloyl-ACP methyl ester carboxylesterase